MTHQSAFVTGDTGFVGRWLVLDLLRQSQHVIVLLRSAAGLEMKEWVAAKGVDPARLTAVRGDLTAPDLGLDAASLKRLQNTRDVFHLGGRYAFGLSKPTPERRLTSHAATRDFSQGRCLARLGPGVRRRALHAAAHQVSVWLSTGLQSVGHR